MVIEPSQSEIKAFLAQWALHGRRAHLVQRVAAAVQARVLSEPLTGVSSVWNAVLAAWAAVTAVAGSPFAFVIAGRDAPSPAMVISYCKRRLPAHLVPRFVIFMDDFPRTFIGKVLRRELARRYEKHTDG